MLLEAATSTCPPVAALSRDRNLSRTTWYHGNGSVVPSFILAQAHTVPLDGVALSLPPTPTLPPVTCGPLTLLHCLLTI